MKPGEVATLVQTDGQSSIRPRRLSPITNTTMADTIKITNKCDSASKQSVFRLLADPSHDDASALTGSAFFVFPENGRLSSARPVWKSDVHLRRRSGGNRSDPEMLAIREKISDGLGARSTKSISLVFPHDAVRKRLRLERGFILETWLTGDDLLPKRAQFETNGNVADGQRKHCR